jgi:hypothetical protein
MQFLEPNNPENNHLKLHMIITLYSTIRINATDNKLKTPTHTFSHHLSIQQKKNSLYLCTQTRHKLLIFWVYFIVGLRFVDHSRSLMCEFISKIGNIKRLLVSLMFQQKSQLNWTSSLKNGCPKTLRIRWEGWSQVVGWDSSF